MTENSFLDKLKNGFKKIFTNENLRETEKLNEAKNLKYLNLTLEQIDMEIKDIFDKETGIYRVKELFTYRFSIFVFIFI